MTEGGNNQTILLKVDVKSAHLLATQTYNNIL